MNIYRGTPLNIQAITDSGQSFRWQKYGSDYYNVIRDQVVKIHPISNNEFYWQTFPQPDNHELLRWHLNLDKDYSQIISSINKDSFIDRAIKKYWGLRELRQDPYETLISYIISANNSIKRISRSIHLLAQNFGRRLIADDHEFYTFPDAGLIDQISEAQLAQVTRVGFRAKYVKKTAAAIRNSFDLNVLTQAPKTEISRHLQTLDGVGPKIADCVSLFALGHDQVVPIDVWMRRILERIYNQPPTSKYKDLQEFAANYFGPYAGWAHQFLFMHAREYGVDRKSFAP